MRIYTEVIMNWDEKQGKLVEVSSESFEYGGEVALALGSSYSNRKRNHAYSEHLKDTYRDEEGNTYKIYRRKWRSNKRTGSTKWRDYIVVATDKDGNFISGSSKSGNSESSMKDYARTKASNNVIFSDSEWQAKQIAAKESNRLDLKAHEAVAQAKQSAADVTAKQTEIAQRQTARVSGEAIRQQKEALLSQGYNPEEARMMTAQGSENISRTIADVGMQGQAIYAQTVGQLAQFGAEQGWTAENLSQGIKQMQTDLMKHREQLANQLQVTKMQTQAQKDVAGKAMWGEILGGAGEAVGAYYGAKS